MINNFRTKNIFALIVFALILISLQLMSSATQASSELSALYTWLLFINGFGSVVLLILVGVNITTLIKQLKKREAGSKLTTRMVSLFVLLALAPAAIVFYFSMQFLHQGIDSWFNVEIDRAMEDALELSQASLDQRLRWHSKQTEQLGEKLNAINDNTAAADIEQLRDNADAVEMTLFSHQGRIIASSSSNPSDILPNLPDANMWLQLRQNGQYAALTPLGNGRLIIRVIVSEKNVQPRYLQALYSVPVRMTDLADFVEFAFVRYQEMTHLRHSLRVSFSLVLSLVLLMSLSAAIWIAFISIRNIVAPVKALVKGTQAVASGHYDQQLPVIAQDDLGFLVESFNEMTQRIARARDETRLAGVEVENQRQYLATILTNLTAGVISFDAAHRIRTANQATYKIFNVSSELFLGQTLIELSRNAAELQELTEALKLIQQLLEQSPTIWQQRLAFLGANGRQELLCRGTPLFTASGERSGAVIVFDDVTDLMQAQKNAAWGEVARRLAHEIKNPLTPIQLSAERLQHKLAAKLTDKDALMLTRATETIIQQVEAMKEMVDDFSEYAKSSKKQTVAIHLAQLIQEIVTLYAARRSIQFITDYENTPLIIQADPISMRQVLHNLIKNAIEAIDTVGTITIRLQRVTKNMGDFIEIALYDNGSGIKEEQLERIFEPYVTTKAKGTGLGLAIVKKIIEEHGGSIWVDTKYHAGAGFIMHLPAA